jgi:hypothetical protein
MRLGETEQATRRVAAALALIAEDDGSPELADARALVTSGRSGLGSARCRTTRS